MGTSQTENVESTAAEIDDDAGSGPSTDEIFKMLSNGRRRHLLHYLLQRDDGAATKRVLSTELAAWENDVPAGAVTSDMRKPIYIALHQTHLPRMADTGIIAFDETGDEVRLTDRVRDVTVYMDVVEQDEVSWSQFYLGLGAIWCALVAAVALGIGPFSLLPPILWAGVIAGLLTVTGLVHTCADRRRPGAEGPTAEFAD